MSNLGVAENLKIEIRPIPNRNRIREFSENLEYFSQSTTLYPFVNPKTRRYETGLTKEDVENLKADGFPYELDDHYVAGVPHTFWESQIVKVELQNNPMFLYPGKSTIDFIKWKFLSVNSYIYSSEEEMLTGSKPEATHYIYNEDHEVAIRATKLEIKNQLIKDLSNVSLQRKRNLILIINNENTDNKDENYLTVKFDEIINNEQKSELLRTLLDMKAEDLNLKAEVLSAIHKNVLRRTKKGIFFFENNLGFSEEDAAKFLSKPENQEIYLNIKQKIE